MWFSSFSLEKPLGMMPQRLSDVIEQAHHSTSSNFDS
jgi:hypothetical protein